MQQLLKHGRRHLVLCTQRTGLDLARHTCLHHLLTLALKVRSPVHELPDRGRIHKFFGRSDLRRVSAREVATGGAALEIKHWSRRSLRIDTYQVV